MTVTREEQETTINLTQVDDVAFIWSNIPHHVRKMRAEQRYTQTDGDEKSGSFTVPLEDFRPLTLKRKITLTDEQRAERGKRLAASQRVSETVHT